MSQYRAGVPKYLPEEREKYKDDEIPQQYFALLDEILALRQSYELPDFVNRTSASIPEDIATRCNEIETENPQPWSVFVD